MARLPRQLESLARMLTYILSHRPDEFGLVLSEEGFIPIKHLLQALSAEPGWGFVRRYHLDQVVGLMSPPAFEVEGEQIRALTPEPARLRRDLGEPPPALLYAAIPPKAHARVWEEGLKPLPDREIVFLGVGFETTAPAIGGAIKTAAVRGVGNFSVLSSVRTIPEAMGVLAQTDARMKGMGNLPTELEFELCLGKLLALR